MTRSTLLALAAGERLQALLSYLRRHSSRTLRVRPDAIDPQRPLTAYGLDSLAAIELGCALQTDLGIDLPYYDLLAGPTLAELAEQLLARLAVAPEPATALPAPPPSASQPLSYGQQALWFLHRLAPRSPAYNIAVALRVGSAPAGPAGRAAPAAPADGRRSGEAALELGLALAAIVERHESLRGCFGVVDGQPVHRLAIHGGVPPALEVIDAEGWDATLLRQRLNAEAWKPFDLSSGPLLRTLLFTGGPGGPVLLFAVHHIAADLWSLAILARELGALYSGAPLAPVAASYGDWVRRQQERLGGSEGERLWAYWHRQLGGELPVLELPTDRPRPASQSFRGAARSRRLPEAASRLMSMLAAQATLHTVLAAVYLALLHRHTGQTDVSIGTPAAGRGTADFAGVVGYFVNPLVLRVDLAGNPTFGELFIRSREAMLQALAHQDFPFPLLAERLRPERDPGRLPLVQNFFALQQVPAPGPPELAALALGEDGVRFQVGALQLESIALDPPFSQFDVTLSAAEISGGLGLAVQYATDLFDGATMERLLGHFVALLSGAAADPRARVSEVPLLDEAERRQLAAWSGAGERYSASGSLHGRLEACAAARPDAVALVCEGQSVSYGELDRLGNRLARRLLAAGVEPGSRVGLAVGRGTGLVAGILGILKAGCAYVPLDPTYPRERLGWVLADASVAALVSEPETLAALPAWSGPVLPWALAASGHGEHGEHGKHRKHGRPPELGQGGELEDGDAGSPGVTVGPEWPAYVIYTSGSTGRPKGVVVSHGNVLRLLAATPGWFGFGAHDVWTLLHSFAFDFSVWELWGALLHGGRLVVVPFPVSRSPAELVELVERAGVTVLCQTPPAFAALQQAALAREPATLASLRWVILGGEALDTRSLEGWWRRWRRDGASGPGLVNLYGTTEATVYQTYRRLGEAEILDQPGGGGSVIGVPLPDLRLWVLDGWGEPLPIGVAGELYVGGAGVSQGYLGRPDLTAERFVPDRFGDEAGARLYRTGDLVRWQAGGELEYLGRIDQQVKLRGFRIELGEIEAALLEQPGVAAAVVVVREDVPGDRRLVAYVVVPAPGTPAMPAMRKTPGVPPAPEGVDFAELRGRLRERLPEYMVPSAFVRLEELPLSPGGKVDRRGLPAPGGREAAGESPAATPRTLPVRLLQGIWQELFGIDHVAPEDDFFALGGHSLLATRLTSRVRDVLGLEMPVALLFRAPTLAGLAAELERGLLGDPPPPLRRRGAEAAAPPLSFAQERLWFLDRLEPGSPLYNLPAAVSFAGPLVPAALEQAVAAVVRRHEALRTRFPEIAGRPVQAIDPVSEVSLSRHFRLNLVDLAGLPRGAVKAEAERLAGEEARRPFALDRGPLLRGRLLRLGPRRHTLLLTLHHIVADGWSLGILLREVAAFYEGAADAAADRCAGPPPPPLQYADFALWQREWLQGEALAVRLDHFRKALDGVPVLALPVDRPRPPVADHRGGRRPVAVPAPLAASLRALCRRAGATPFMALLAVFQALLSRHAGQEDFAVGVPVAGRTARQTEAVIGLFANTVVLRAELAGDPSLAALLAGVRAAALGAYTHQDVPFEKVVDALAPDRDLSRTPLFQVMFALADFPAEMPGRARIFHTRPSRGAANGPGSQAREGRTTEAYSKYVEGGRPSATPETGSFPVPQQEGREICGLPGVAARVAAVEARVAKFELTLELAEADGRFAGGLEYSSALFDAPTACRLADHFLELLGAAVAAPDRPLSLLSFAGAGERHQLLYEWSGGGRETAVETAASTVHGAFAAQAARTPDAAALVGGGEELSFGALAQRAGLLARRLRELGVDQETVVGVLLPGSIDLAVSLLAVLAAGGAYLPLDPAQPAARNAAQLADAGARLLLTRGCPPALPGWAGAVVDVDVGDGLDPASAAAAAHARAPVSRVDPGQLAYVIYTSGSTGRPKGVAVPHRALLQLSRAAAERYRLGPGDRVLQFASPAFDVAAEELFASWLAGAAVVLSPGPPESISDFTRHLAAEGVTVANLPASFWHAWVAELADAPPPESLRRIVVGSERVAPERLAAWRERVGNRVRIDNAYGVTEATVTTAVHDTGHDTSAPAAAGSATVPVGRPLAGSGVLLLDRALVPVPAGAHGELAIGGQGLARGYLGRPDLTAERFVPHPFAAAPGARLFLTGDLARHRSDGTLEILGRRDRQVKVRGVRIEPAEVEAALEAHPQVARAVVALRPGREGVGPGRLVAWIVPRGSRASAAPAAPAAPTARELRAFLSARLPEAMLPAAFVELTELPLTASGKPDRAALPDPERPAPPAGPAAPRSAAEAALAEVWARVLGLADVPLDENFFALGGDSITSLQVISGARAAGLQLTVRQLFQNPTVAALAAVAERAPETQTSAAQEEPAGSFPLTPIQRWYFAENQPDPHHFNQALLLTLREPLALQRLAGALLALVERHAALRLRFGREDGEWRQSLAPFPGLRGGTPLPLIAPLAPLAVVDLAALPRGRRPQALATAAADAQTGFDLGLGLLFRAVLFRAGRDDAERLLVVAHHLAVDAVSWSILLGDLAAAYRLQALPQPAGPASTPWWTWARLLAAHADAAAVHAELAWWLAAAPRRMAPLPLDFPGGDDIEAHARTVTVELAAAETQALLRAAARPPLRTEDALLAALARAVAGWTGERRIWIDLEGHGREDLFPAADLSRTVGWFTTLFPVLLDAAPEAGPGAALKGVKERLRTLPARGIGYGLLRYVSGLPEAAALAALPRPEISFNYLGQLGRLAGGEREGEGEDGLFSAARLSGPERSPRARRTHLLEVRAWLLDGRLRLDWTYSATLHARATIERLAGAMAAELRALIAHCRAAGTAGWTPSDFPLARLDQDAIDRLLGGDREVEDLYPLSPVQQGMLFHTLQAPRSGAYVEQLGWTFVGAFDAAAWRRAWLWATARHPVLRTAFLATLEEPLQLVRPRADPEWHTDDWSGLAPARQAELLARRLVGDRERGFELGRAPLQRFALIELGGGRRQFVWSHHHLLLDGWSVALVLTEVLAAFEAFSRGREPALPPVRPFRDYIAYLATRDAEADREFWRAQLAGFTAPTRLEIDRPAARDAGVPEAPEAPEAAETPETPATPEIIALERDAYGSRRRVMGAAISADLRGTARRRGWTPGTLVHAAWALLLARYGAGSDLVFGGVVSGRTATLPGAEHLVGLLINTLPVRAELPDSARRLPASTWIDAFQARLFEIRQHEATPLPEIQGASGVPRRLPLFESIVACENYPLDQTLRDWRAGARVEDLFAADRTHYPLTLIAALEERLSLHLLFARRRFAAAAVERLAGHLANLLGALVADPDLPLAELSLLTVAERHQMLLEHNDATALYPAAACVHQLVAAQAARTPEAVAVSGGGQMLRYGELAALAGRLARRLARLGVGPEVLVGVCAGRSPALLVALLAVLEAGGAYVPLDPTHPRERLGAILADSAARVVLAERALLDRLPAHEARIVPLDLVDLVDLENQAAQQRQPGLAGGVAPAAPALPPADPENLAYLIYTSGSTGRPKGVEVRHRAAVNYLAAMAARPGLGRGDVMLAVTTLSFDIAVTELLLPLTVGARIELVSDTAASDATLLAAAIDAAGATCMQATPATWTLLVEGGWPGRPGLKALCGGEALPRTLADQLLPRVAELWNLYGPTETTVWSALQRVGPGERPVPLGRPLANTSLQLFGRLGGQVSLGPLGPLVPLGVAGELAIGGEGLARGYHGRPHLTAERFVPDPFGTPGSRLYRTGDLARRLPGGELEFLGRLDHQVKIRGYRIELGEIEAVLGQHPMVAAAVALARQDAPGDSRLVAYVVPTPEVRHGIGAESLLELQAEHLAQWREVYDQVFASQAAPQAGGSPAAADPDFNLAGWRSSHTGEPISAAEMREQVEQTAARVLALAPQVSGQCRVGSPPRGRRVLEIGCGTGLLLFRLAPHCARYHATDFSRSALDYVEHRLRGKDLPQVLLEMREAHDFAGIEAGSFDAVVLNSVAQYFPSADYLVRVLQAACGAVAPGGCVFVGDVRSLPLLWAFHAAVQLEQAPAGLTAGELRRRVQGRVQGESELVLDPRFFDALREHLPRLASVVVEPRRGSYHNELTRYRYDVLLRLDSRPSLPAAVPWQEWAEQPLSLPALRRRLAGDAPSVLALAGVPNARLAAATRAVEWLERVGPERPVRELREHLANGETAGLAGMDPEDLWRLGEELPYRIDLRWAAHGPEGRFDAVFRRRGSPWDGLPEPLELCRGGAGGARGAWSAYASQPLAGRSRRALAAALRGFLQGRLPDYMVPAAVVVLDELPLTANGKIDRGALPGPDPSIREQPERFVAPRTPVEEAVAAIWRDLLGLTQVGVEDDFFALGGHSLLAGRLIARLRAAFGVEIELSALLDEPTLGAMAAVVEGALDRPEEADLDELLDRLEGMAEAEAERLVARLERSA